MILSPPSRRVLIVDDDAAVLNASVALLVHAGFQVDAASSGEMATAMLQRESYSAILSDINMTGMSGLDLLRTIRERGLETPVVLFTGGASLTTALDAMAWGAHRYLLKPVSPPELIEVVTRAVLLSDLTRLKREVFALRETQGVSVDNEAEVQQTFSRALERIAMVFHPIISLRQRRSIGFEALVRTTEPSLANPEAFLATAALLDRQDELTRAIYTNIASHAKDLPDGRLLFVNVHPPDLMHPSLHGLGSPLAPFADRIVLEITERASLEKLGDIRAVVAGLRQLRYRLAVDDLGTGYAGLASFTQLSPDIVKLDRSLVCGIDRDTTKQRVVRAMTLLCADLGMQVIAEGIETHEERATLEGLGADLLQGWLFGKPKPNFAEPVI